MEQLAKDFRLGGNARKDAFMVELRVTLGAFGVEDGPHIADGRGHRRKGLPLAAAGTISTRNCLSPLS